MVYFANMAWLGDNTAIAEERNGRPRACSLLVSMEHVRE